MAVSTALGPALSKDWNHASTWLDNGVFGLSIAVSCENSDDRHVVFLAANGGETVFCPPFKTYFYPRLFKSRVTKVNFRDRILSVSLASGSNKIALL